MTQEEAKQALKERQTTFSKKIMIEKHGEDEGSKKVEERNKKWFKTLKENNDWGELSKSKAITLEKMIVKYGKEKGTEKWNNFIDGCTGRYSEQWFIDFYGTEYGYEKYITYKEKLKGRNTLDWFKQKYGEIEGSLHYESYREKTIVPIGKASIESLEVFLPVFDYLIENGFEKNDIYFGVEGSREWFIKNDNDFFLYDFTIKSKKIIIEYHGVAFHPKKHETLWESPFGVSYNEAFKKDTLKKETAEQKGFKLLEVWSDEKNKKEKVLTFIMENCDD